MVIFLHVADQPSGRILDRLEFLSGVIGQACEDTVTVVQSGRY